MDVTDALYSRYSTRAFKPDPVDRKAITRILEAAIRAPSWANTQPWEIFVAGGDVLSRLRNAYLEDFRKGVAGDLDLPKPQQWPHAMQKRMEELAAERYKIAATMGPDEKTVRQAIFEANYKFFGAPVVIYLCMDRTLTPWSIFDIGMLAQSIMLAAQQHGLGSIPAVSLVSYPALIHKELEIPDELSIIFGIALGYSDAQHPQNKLRSSRRSVQEVVRFKGF